MRPILPYVILSACLISGCSDSTATTTPDAASKPATADVAAPKAASADAPIPQKDGFVTKVVDKRIWVFRAGTPELGEFEKTGDLAKQVTRIGAGPNGMTIKGPDGDTIDAYLKASAK
jgi:hypothetical protein